jgi:hypothetical protein
MRVAPLYEVKNQFTKFIQICEEEPIFITRNGKIAAVLEHMTDKNIEDYLVERSRKFRKMLREVKKQEGGISLEDYRKSRKI